jgi:predicted O-methyltransferase YrrM
MLILVALPSADRAMSRGRRRAAAPAAPPAARKFLRVIRQQAQPGCDSLVDMDSFSLDSRRRTLGTALSGLPEARAVTKVSARGAPGKIRIRRPSVFVYLRATSVTPCSIVRFGLRSESDPWYLDGSRESRKEKPMRLVRESKKIVRRWPSAFLAACFAALVFTGGANPGDAQRPPINYDEAKVPAYTLPDPLVAADGRKIADAEAWRSVRRPEVLRLFEEHMFGRTPRGDVKTTFESIEVDRTALGGKAVRKQAAIRFAGNGKTASMDLLVYLPASAPRPVPVFLGLNFQGNHAVNADPGIRLPLVPTKKDGVWTAERADPKTRGAAASRWPVDLILSRGYGVATAFYGDIDPDFDDGFRNGSHPLFYRQGQERPDPGEWGSIGAWAWGLSRALDFLETDAEIDRGKVAVLGHSRLGKTALWAGAQDERFAIVISNDSGCGGAALSRRRFGETVEVINNAFPHWFCANFKRYNGREDDLPIDQHLLVALAAPRPVYVASAEEDRWADPKGEFLAAKGADPVYRLLGTEGLPATDMPPVDRPAHGRIGYHIRRGPHNITEVDWGHYLDFADRQYGRASPAAGASAGPTGDAAGQWASLFDGKSLAGWKVLNGTAKYEVEGKAIVGTTAEGSPNSFLCTERHYGDFELQFDVKVDPRLNSGVQVRSQSRPDYESGRVHGYQVEIAVGGDAGRIYDEARRAVWLDKDRSDPKARAAFVADGWNRYRVLCLGDRIRTWVNGVPVADVTDSMDRAGFIGLQVHSFKGDTPAQVRWRNLFLRPIPGVQPAAAAKPRDAAAAVIDEVEKACLERTVYMIGRKRAEFLAETVRRAKPRVVVECGTAIGYSGLWIARELRDAGGGKLVTIEISPERAREAEAIFRKAGLADFVTVKVGDARKLAADAEGPVDLVFIDCDFGNYEPVWKAIEPKLRDGATIVADNVLIGEKGMAGYLEDLRSRFPSRSEWFEKDLPWCDIDAMEVTTFLR